MVRDLIQTSSAPVRPAEPARVSARQSGSTDQTRQKSRISEDSVELSREARDAETARAPRHDLIARVRSEIEQGRYETPDKLDAVVEKLLKELG